MEREVQHRRSFAGKAPASEPGFGRARYDVVPGLLYVEGVAMNGDRDEEIYELYYRWHFTEKFHLSTIIQRVEDRQGVSGNDPLWVFGARLQVDF